jgi:hypothetical protein
MPFATPKRAGAMSTFGHSRTLGHVRFTPKADISSSTLCDVRFVPCVDGSELARRIFTRRRLGRCSHMFGL